jgi:hypothetical protein
VTWVYVCMYVYGGMVEGRKKYLKKECHALLECNS